MTIAEHDAETGAAAEAGWLGTLVRFYRCLDAGDVDGLLALTHPAFIWLRQGKELRSPDEIRAVLVARAPELHVFHLLSSVVFERVAHDHVRYSGYLAVLRARADPAAAVGMRPSGAQSLHVCAGEFRETAGGWRIAAMNAGPPRLLLDLAEELT